MSAKTQSNDLETTLMDIRNIGRMISGFTDCEDNDKCIEWIGYLVERMAGQAIDLMCAERKKGAAS